MIIRRRVSIRIAPNGNNPREVQTKSSDNSSYLATPFVNETISLLNKGILFAQLPISE